MSIDKNKNCIELDGFHAFEPRYDEEEYLDHDARDKAIKFYKEDRTAPMLNDYRLKRKTYVCDVCVQCGEKVERK